MKSQQRRLANLILLIPIVLIACRGNVTHPDSHYFHVRFGPSPDAPKSSFEELRYGGSKLRISKSIALDLCDVEEISLIEYDNPTEWAVALEPDSEAKKLELESRAVAIILGGEIRLLAKLLNPRIPNFFQIPATSKDEAYQLASKLDDILAGISTSCGHERRGSPIEVIQIPRGRERVDRIEPVLLEHPPLSVCTDEAKSKGLHASIVLRIEVDSTGTASTHHWFLMQGEKTGLEEEAVRQISETWKFQPATENGKPGLR